MENLERIAEEVRACTKCSLCKSRSKAVPGEGPGNSQVMFIGEGPGFYEDREGRPFVGPAGRFLEELLLSIGLKREDVYITNMVKCRPPNNRDPLPAEIQACDSYLERQIQLIQPKVIVTLGRYSLARFFPKETVTRARGKPRKKDGLVIYPMLHPAAALHRQDLRKVIEGDIKAIPDLLQQTEASKEPSQPPGQQLSMF